MMTGVPDRDLFGLPRLDRADADGLRRDERDVAATTGAGILRNRERMEVDDAGCELAVVGRRWWRVLVAASTRQRIVERPVLHVSLSALHHRTSHAGVPGGPVLGRISFGELQMLVRHAEAAADPAETELAIGALEAQWMGNGDFLAGLDVEPLVH